jgi:hypothetical protein
MKKKKLLDEREATITQLEARLAGVEPYEDIARTLHERAVDTAVGTSDVELAYHEAVATTGFEMRAAQLLAAFDELPAIERFAILRETFDDDDVRELLASRCAIAVVRERARQVHALDVRSLRAGQVVDIGLFQPHRIDTARRLGRRSDFCSRVVTLQIEDGAGALRVVTDQFLMRGAYDGPSEYPRTEWEREALPDHAVVYVGMAVRNGDGEVFDRVVGLGSRFDVECDGQVVRSRLSVGYVEVDGEDIFTTA